MSRSYKKNLVIKDKKFKRYWKTIRSRVKTVIRSHKKDWQDLDIPNEKTLVNDYDYRDYKFWFSKKDDRKWLWFYESLGWTKRKFEKNLDKTERKYKQK